MSRRLLTLIASLIAFASSPAQPRQTRVSVRLFSRQRVANCRVGSLHSSCEFRAGGKLVARSGQSELREVSRSGTGLTIRSAGKEYHCSSPLYICPSHGEPVAVGARPIPPRVYLGRLRISVRGGELLVVNELEFGQYLRCVVPAEVPRSFHPAALQAQAIVARTWTYRNRSRHRTEGYDFCDLTHCQAYKGTTATTPETDQAVVRTQGLVITWHSKAISPLYHSTCGGHTADNNQVWGGSPLPYLRGVLDSVRACAYCAASPHARWQLHLTKPELAAVSHLRVPLSFIVTERDPSGRASRVRIAARDGQVTMTGYQFYLAAGHALGWNRVKSAWFRIEASGDGFDLNGKGLGHGVGLCQWGANGMAVAGVSCREILQHYYQGVEIGSPQ